jgi:hypothetical protein
VALEQAVQLSVQLDDPPPAGQGLSGQLADQAGSQPLPWDHQLLSRRGGQGPLGQALDLTGRQPTGGLQMGHQAGTAGGTDLGRGDIAADQPQPTLAGQIQHPFQSRVDADQQVMQASQAAGLLDLQVPSAAHQQPQLQVQLTHRLDGSQVTAGADLLGNHPGITRVAFVLTPGGALAGPVDRQPRHMDQPEPGHPEHCLGQPGDPAHHIQADHRHPTQRIQPIDQLLEGSRVIRHPLVPHHLAEVIDSGGPVHVLGDVDPNPDPHRLPPPVTVPALSSHAGIALHSDWSQSLISGPGRAVGRGELRPKPSTAASMTTIPTPPVHPDPATHRPGCELKGRAA